MKKIYAVYGGKLIKLITVDLDGTLFDSNSRISNKNKQAIRDCIKGEIKVVVSTGKSIKCVDAVIRELGLVDPQIASGGTVIITPDLEILSVMKVPRKSVLNAIDLGRKNNIGFGLDTTDGTLYYESEHPDLKYIFESGEFIEKVDDIKQDNIVDNALLLTFTVNASNAFNGILENNIDADVKIRRGGPYFLNIMSQEAGKVAGLKKILGISGIDKDEVMAIGDNNNDLGTIKFAGLGVAMGNASEEVKLAADYISSDNDNDGVAEAINRFIRF
ncbi:MAG: HAD family hydrolase [Actinobacteria bacterium]|nr:HAD family hydrolase [Actinomycetota bacterium]